ncbi:DNA-binding MarR family transcriptional regulator [Croceifilum oryzae]|uniref:DNA-binding MarR family transcriptional regulator n=1 Tax=Croceifilum oryzae TaxID=1553429 RepID=A0AAJ1WV60_9BACL|nr:replication/maintenance protein RepL [Croceifilum oryzae]MDQ0418676.1 DNA-binding MarR family transcriptional regulator [Croceifilum oryzae]
MDKNSYVDLETGEVKSKREYRLQNINQADAYKAILKKEEYRDRQRSRNWIACFHQSIQELSTELKLHELGVVMNLLPYTKFNGKGQLVKDGEVMRIADITEVIGRSKRSTITIMNKLEGLNVILKRKERNRNIYSLNPHYHSIGKLLHSDPFTKVYQLAARKMLRNLTLKQAGILYKLLPHFHYETYYLSHNPNEADLNEIKHMNQRELAQAIHEDVRTLRTHMKDLQSKGFVMIQKSSNTDAFIVNPDIMFRKDVEDEYTDVVRKQFYHQQLKESQELDVKLSDVTSGK